MPVSGQVKALQKSFLFFFLEGGGGGGQLLVKFKLVITAICFGLTKLTQCRFLCWGLMCHMV